MIFNTTGKERDDVVSLGAFAGEALRDDAGEVYPVQRTENGAVAYVKNIPSKGYKSFAVLDAVPALVESDANAVPFRLINERKLETPFYTVKLDEQGMFTSVYDKENDREVIQEGHRANLFRMYSGMLIRWNAWSGRSLARCGRFSPLQEKLQIP